MDEDAEVRSVGFNEAAFDEQCAEQRFGDEQEDDPERGAAGAGGFGLGVEDSGDERDDERGENAGEGAVGELDDGGEAWVVREDFSVAERPVVAATCAGAGGADYGSLRG